MSLSKPLTHQRTHAFDPQSIHNENEIFNNNYLTENRFTTFKSDEKELRKSNRSSDKKKSTQQRNICKTNNDIEYIRDPIFDMSNYEMFETYTQAHPFNNSHRNSKNYLRMHERNGSERSDQLQNDNVPDRRRQSNKSLKFNNNVEVQVSNSKDELGNHKEKEGKIKMEDDKPKPGKVKELASKFNKNSTEIYKQAFIRPKNRPKPLTSYGNQAYIDHVFPDAIEI